MFDVVGFGEVGFCSARAIVFAQHGRAILLIFRPDIICFAKTICDCRGTVLFVGATFLPSRIFLGFEFKSFVRICFQTKRMHCDCAWVLIRFGDGTQNCGA